MLYKDLCTACGAKIRKNCQTDVEYSKSFSASGGREVKITNEEANRIEQANMTALLSMRKLSLVLDLDHTLLNASASLGEEKAQGSHEVVICEGSRSHKYYIKLRPNLNYFLEELRPLYQMSIYTHATRKYAESTCNLMDPEGIYFGKRIVSRTDYPELGASKSLSKLLKTDWSMVLIYDDREDVWKGEQRDHLLCAKPFVYFDTLSNGAVVNNSPGLLTLESKANQRRKSSSDEDQSLVHAVAIFKKLHKEFFTAITSGQKNSIGRVLRNLRKSTLVGCVICFSGIFPLSDSISSQNRVQWIMAENLGAEVELDVTDNTTHLLTAGLGTRKSRMCIDRDDVYVLHCDWLLHCNWNVRREDESLYFLSSEHNPCKADFKVVRRAAEIEKCNEDYNTYADDGAPKRKIGRFSEGAHYSAEEQNICDKSDSSSDDEWLQELEDQVESASGI